jgi:hypothetical protein
LQIRTAHAQGESIRSLSRRLGRSQKTIRKIRSQTGESFIIFELVQNAWDSGARHVSITLVPVPGSPLATL